MQFRPSPALKKALHNSPCSLILVNAMNSNEQPKSVTRIDVHTLTANDILAGKTAALHDLPKFMAAITAAPEKSTIILDWAHIQLVTSSYFAGTLIAILRLAIGGALDKYFINTGLNQSSTEELRLVLGVEKLAVLTGSLASDGSVRDVSILGLIDPVYAETFAVVTRPGRRTASELHAKSVGRGRIGKTGWINRLSFLHRLRLI